MASGRDAIVRRSCSFFEGSGGNGGLSSFQGRKGSLIFLGVLGILFFALQCEDIRPGSMSTGSSRHFSSFVNCTDATNAEGVRRPDNSWGAFDPVISSTNCTTMLASRKSSNPMDWLQMCYENHDIYKRYMAGAKGRNHLNDIIPSGSNNTREKLSLLVVGDSIDKFMVYHICNITMGTVVKVDPPKYSYRRPFVCSSSTVEIGFLNIFGMRRTCENAGVAYHQDRRPFNTTVDRVASLLPDVLERMHSKPNSVLIGSALWDLSQGCVGRNGIPKAYREEYSLGMRNLYDYFVSGDSGLADNASIFWRNSPPLRKSYSKKWARISWIPFNVGAHGRTRRNQVILNQIMNETLLKFQVGSGIVDWWQIIQGVSERFLDQELPDGRHYTFCSCLAFFNEWLEHIHLLMVAKK